MTITALPSAPLLTDTTENFNTKAFAWVGALDTFTDEANALAVAANDDAVTAANAADTATDKAAEAAAAAANAAGVANVVQWLSDATYVEGF